LFRELLKCAEFIDAVSKWPAKTRKKYLNAIGFNTNEIDDVNTPDEPSREEQLLRQIEEVSFLMHLNNCGDCLVETTEC
jgi:hypothetical protein